MNKEERLEKQARLREIAKLIWDLKLERDKIEMDIVEYNGGGYSTLYD